ncbi:MAG: hypothetical protein AAGD05_10575, partial [Bacteroidota bacterium]
FPMAEPASTVPKNVIGLKVLTETYHEVRLVRNQFSLRLMYGVTPNLTVWVQPMVSNHHDRLLPRNIVTHRHVGPSTVLITGRRNYGASYDYRLSGVHFYAKYRFLTFDSDDQHFRMAFYAEATPMGSTAHDEAEPHLQGDNRGYGAGIIATYLKSRAAVSFTGGFIRASDYRESNTDLNFHLQYGDAYQYSLSFGYLLYPRKYDGYHHTNYNLYVEFIGKSYGAAALTSNGEPISIESAPFQEGSYLDVNLGIQQIIRSNDRLELSVGFDLINRSYRHFYPVINFGWQHYFYL